MSTAWLLDHEVEHEPHLERRFSIAALVCPVASDSVHQFPQLTLPTVSGAKPQKFVVRNASKLSQAEQLVLAKDSRFLAVTDEHIDGSELAARSVLLMRFVKLQLRDANAKAVSPGINWSRAASHRLRFATWVFVTDSACRPTCRSTLARPSPRPTTTGGCHGEV